MLKIFRAHWNKKLRERNVAQVAQKFARIFYEFKVYIFLLKVSLYFLIIFWKVWIDTLYKENGSWKSLPGKITISLLGNVNDDSDNNEKTKKIEKSGGNIWKHRWEYFRWEFSGEEFTSVEFDWWKFSEWEFSGWEFLWYRRKFMRKILKFTFIDNYLHQKNLHSPNP